MKKQAKILLTNINADKDREESLKKYLAVTASAFKKYATIKMSLNLFTMYEMSEEISLDRREEIEDYIDSINAAIRGVYVDGGADAGSEGPGADASGWIEDISNIRNKITEKMKVLTAYTDAFQNFEYILNRREPLILETVDEEIDTDALAESMYQFVFSENDKMLVNTRIQEFIAQLPVRMTKSRFFDIITNSLQIYRGGEQTSVDAFAQTIRDAALLDMPKGFESEYPELKAIYDDFKGTDFLHLDKAAYDALSDKLTEGTSIIQSEVTNYLMLTEIINDVLVVLYSTPYADEALMDDKYETAALILKELVTADDIYEASSQFDELFVKLEGAQEEAYEDVAFTESQLEDLNGTYYEIYDSEEIRGAFDSLDKASTLTSTSLFMDIDDNKDITVVADEADEIYIAELRESLVEDLSAAFENLSKLEKRSVMAKILSLMPVFFNSQQEILDYFKYALSSCSDKAELTAFRDIVSDIMM